MHITEARNVTPHMLPPVLAQQLAHWTPAKTSKEIVFLWDTSISTTFERIDIHKSPTSIQLPNAPHSLKLSGKPRNNRFERQRQSFTTLRTCLQKTRPSIKHKDPEISPAQTPTGQCYSMNYLRALLNTRVSVLLLEECK